MFKAKRQEVKDFQERTVLNLVRVLARNKPDVFNNWSEEKLKLFANYCIKPKKANVPKALKQEFEEVYNSEITFNEIKEMFKV